MEMLKQWWANDLPKPVKFVYLVLLANGLPAFVILMTIPHLTETMFVWTVNPPASARLLGVMYFNALSLVAIGASGLSWANVRITMVVITLFSIMATLLTFVYLKPFLAHPWFHLAYWLSMYIILFFAAPYVFYTHERKYGGKLPVNLPLNLFTKIVLLFSVVSSAFFGYFFLFNIEAVNMIWPWNIAPLVGGLIGVLMVTHTAAYLWALWDGDWIRVRPMFWQAIVTYPMLILLFIIHWGDIESDMTNRALLVIGVALIYTIAHGTVVLMYRSKEKQLEQST